MSNRKWFLYQDTIHGLYAAGTSKTMAWGLIRNECHSKGWEVPTMDKINYVRELSDEQVKQLQKS